MDVVYASRCIHCCYHTSQSGLSDDCDSRALVYPVQVPVELTVGDVPSIPVAVVVSSLGTPNNKSTAPHAITLEYRPLGAFTAPPNVETVRVLCLLFLDPFVVTVMCLQSLAWSQSTRGHSLYFDTLAQTAGEGRLAVVVTDATSAQSDTIERSVPVKQVRHKCSPCVATCRGGLSYTMVHM